MIIPNESQNNADVFSKLISQCMDENLFHINIELLCNLNIEYKSWNILTDYYQSIHCNDKGKVHGETGDYFFPTQWAS